MCAKRMMPFEYIKQSEFHEKLVEWVGDVLYDILPEQGYEERDEQIYTAFQIADAICERKVHLAEAGLGTGKTFAYLLSAIPYARFTGKPVVIACATSALQEQLAAEEGDIQILSKLLNLDVDARMAKDPSQYLCDVKVDESVSELSEEMSEWVQKTKRGERSELPTIPDHAWRQISWDESMACDTCLSRGYCKQVKAREYYRPTQDLIIVDHETFFHDLWTRKERILDGKLPILPEYSAVIFDEGHKLVLPASMQAGHQIQREELKRIIASFEEIQGARESLETVVYHLEMNCEKFFEELDAATVMGGSSNRNSIRRTMGLVKSATDLKRSLDQLLFEMQIEQELYMESLPTTLIQAYEGQIERAMIGLTRFLRNKGEEVIVWVDQMDGSFWVVPKNVSEMLNQRLYSQHIPVIFTSATLSSDGNFDYINRTLGLKNVSKSSIGSPFDLEHQVEIMIHSKKMSMIEKYTQGIKELVDLLVENGGHALVLTNGMDEVQAIRKRMENIELPFEILWEDEADRGYLVRRFKEEETSVLVGSGFWEGVDVPGEALTLVIIWQLPFPKLDPLIEAAKQDAISKGLDPITTVDYPEMGLKLKQGCGRLIRTSSDHGKIVIMEPIYDTPWESFALGALPDKAKINTK